MLQKSLALGGTSRRVTLLNNMLSNTSGYMFPVAEGREEGSWKKNPGGVWMATWQQVSVFCSKVNLFPGSRYLCTRVYHTKVNQNSHIRLNMQVIQQGLQVVGGPVEAITLPTLLINIQTDAPIVIKLDIQGFECRVLRHFEMFNTFQNIPYIFMEWNMLGSTENCPDLPAFIGMMEKQG